MQNLLSRSIISLVLGAALVANGGWAQSNGPDAEQANPVSPARKIQRQGDKQHHPEPEFEQRTFSGANNNLEHPQWGQHGRPLQRIGAANYSDGVSSLAGETLPSARLISNAVFAQQQLVVNEKGATDFLWQWGQFLDHDIDLTDGVEPPESAPISVPLGDVFFDLASTGIAEIGFNRSLYDLESGTGPDNPRQQLNEITAWIDASNVYGSDLERALALRTLDGTGQLKVSDGNLLPFNEDGLANAGGSGANLFLAGDVRANEQVGLTAMHTLFVREHNRLASKIAADNPSLSGEEIYQQARTMVGAQMQVITYREFLPLLLGKDALRPYRGYRPEVNPEILNEFSTAAYRLGHSLLSPQILRLDAAGNPVEGGHLSLRDAFFRPDVLAAQGIEPVLRGLSSQVCQRIDAKVIDDVRNFLFGPPGAGGFDLVSLNIQRGRDHGLPSYNDTRRAMGLRPVSSFADVNADPEVTAALAAAYQSVEDIDLWVGGLAEAHYRDAMVGEVFWHILKRQFEVLRDGDRFWYTLALSDSDRRKVEETRLGDIIRRNTTIGSELPANVFRQSDGNKAKKPKRSSNHT